VPYELRAFKADGTLPYGLAAARALGVDPEIVFKTLMAKVDEALWCAVVPVVQQLDLKALARAAKGKRATMATTVEATRATGYVLGGISPLGQRHPRPTVIDRSAERRRIIIVSAGARGLDVALSPRDLLQLTGAKFAAIARV
jgi:Cys-tRNA(Pro)/Cys-tRNA(Cys) deacylase